MAKKAISTWWATADHGAMAVAAAIVAFFLCSYLIGSGIDWMAERRPVRTVEAQSVQEAPDLQAQVDTLRLRVIALELSVSDPPPPALCPTCIKSQTSLTPHASPRLPNPTAAYHKPAAAAWGATDLDRAIESFSPPPSAFAAQPQE
jgi:hypothetical protein